MATSALDPFPRMSPRHQAVRYEISKSPAQPRPRRKSSSLGGEPRGDTGAAALATISDRSPPSTPSVLSRTASERTKPHSKRRKAKSLLRRWKAISLRHTWLNPLIICLIIVSAYLINPTTSNPLHSALFLSYPVPSRPGENAATAPTRYGKGARDFAFVAFYTIFLSFTREFLMQRLIRPLAIYAGVKSRAKQSRFMEQAYTAMYFGVFGPFGLYVMSRTPIWYFNTTAMFEGFPHRTHEAAFKAYYLLQASYWAQQAIVLLLQLEKPRKDFKELVGHHVITIALIWLSYRFHFTYMGLAVYITHDISDFFLATSKTLNYLESPIVGPYFGFFILVWAYLRHYINLHILYATLTEFATVGPYELDWDTQQYKCWISQVITFLLLASLQAVNLFWFVLILRIAKNFLWKKEAAKDVRSDDEDTEKEEKDGEERKGQSILGESKEDRSINGPSVLLNGEPVRSEEFGAAVRRRLEGVLEHRDTGQQ